MPFLPFLAALNLLNFAKIHNDKDSESLNVIEMVDFALLESPNFNFT